MAYANLTDLFKGICDAIRAKKGTTGTINHQDIPSEIESIEAGTVQDVLSLASGLTKYTESFTVDGEERANVLVQPSDFSDETKVTWESSTTYYTHSIESIDGAENGVAAVITPTSTKTTSYSHVFWYDSTVDSSTSDSKTYLIAVRVKASVIPTSYLPQMAITYYPTGSTGGKFLYFSYTPSTEWGIYYSIVNVPKNNYLKDVTMCFCNRGITYYVDWVTAYDITGTSFANMTFGARATASSADVRSGKSFYRDGILYGGSMTNVEKPSPTITVDSTGLVSANYTMSSGYIASGTASNTHYLSSSDDSDFVASNIKSGVSIFGVTGTYSGGNSTVGYIGVALDSTRTNSTSISFSFLDGTDVDNVIGFYVVAIETVDSSSSYDYITSIFVYGSSFTVQSVLNDATVYYNSNSNGTYLSWSILNQGSTTGPIGINISIDDDYLRFRSGVTYRCFPIYKTGGFDVSVDVEVN